MFNTPTCKDKCNHKNEAISESFTPIFIFFHTIRTKNISLKYYEFTGLPEIGFKSSWYSLGIGNLTEKNLIVGLSNEIFSSKSSI